MSSDDMPALAPIGGTLDSDDSESSDDDEDVCAMYESSFFIEKEKKEQRIRKQKMKEEKKKQVEMKKIVKNTEREMKQKKKKKKEVEMSRQVKRRAHLPSHSEKDQKGTSGQGKDGKNKNQAGDGMNNKVLGTCFPSICKKKTTEIRNIGPDQKYSEIRCNSAISPCSIILHFDCWKSHHRKMKESHPINETCNIKCPTSDCTGYLTTLIVYIRSKDGSSFDQKVVNLFESPQKEQLPRPRKKSKKSKKQTRSSGSSKRETKSSYKSKPHSSGKKEHVQDKKEEIEEEEEEVVIEKEKPKEKKPEPKEEVISILKFSDEKHIEKVLQKEKEIKNKIFLRNVKESLTATSILGDDEEEEEQMSSKISNEGVVVDINREKKFGTILTAKKKFFFPLSQLLKNQDDELRIDDRVRFRIVNLGENIVQAHKVEIIRVRISERSRIIQTVVEDPETEFEGIIERIRIEDDFKTTKLYIRFSSVTSSEARKKLLCRFLNEDESDDEEDEFQVAKFKFVNEGDQNFFVGEFVAFQVIPSSSKYMVAQNVKKKVIGRK